MTRLRADSQNPHLFGDDQGISSVRHSTTFTKKAALWITSAIVAFLPLATIADTVEWDAGNPTGNGSVESGPGNWDAVTNNWTVDGGVTNEDFDNGDDVIFGDTGATVTITDPSVDPDSITFNVVSVVRVFRRADGFWLTEALVHLGFHIRRQLSGAASGVSGLSVS